jgi:intracellular sulfur oxidation DsrE/DsrF family protein
MVTPLPADSSERTPSPIHLPGGIVTKRRSFLAYAVSSIGSLAVPGGSNSRAFRPQVGELAETWLQGLTGKHRQFFDVNALNNGAGLRRVSNFFDAYRDAYHLGDRDVNAIFGAHGDGLPYTLTDAIWERFELGARYSVIDPRDHRPARRNIYATSDVGTGIVASVGALQARGTRFLACNQTLGRLARDLAAERKLQAEDVREALVKGLLPGVTLVPAMVIAANRAQEMGLAYLFVG